VFAFGTKAKWSDRELAGLKRYAQQPVKTFQTEEEAAERFLRASGLMGLVMPSDAVVRVGLSDKGSTYRLSADPRTVLVTGSSLADAFKACKAEKRLACGRHDTLVSIEELRSIDPGAVDLGLFGHNIHVQNPRGLLKHVPFIES
jgi:hypothetical protein